MSGPSTGQECNRSEALIDAREWLKREFHGQEWDDYLQENVDEATIPEISRLINIDRLHRDECEADIMAHHIGWYKNQTLRAALK